MTTISVTDSYLLKRGSELDFHDENGFLLTGAGSPALTVGGTLKVTGASASFVQAIHVDESVGQASIDIQKSGVIDVSATGECSAQAAAMFGTTVVVNAGDVEVQADYAAEAFSFGAGGSLNNTGRIHVSSQDNGATIAHGVINVSNDGEMITDGKYAYGVDVTGDFNNSGSVTVTGASSAVGCNVDGNLFNTGAITATAVSGATEDVYGVKFFADGFMLHNDGDIVAEASNGHASYAIYIQPFNTGATQTIDNTGLLQADWALWANPEEGEASSIVLNNSGRIVGDIQMSGDADELHNSGKLAGAIHLNGGDDVYETTGKGKLTGSVDGGAGADVLTGGKSAETLIGGAQDIFDGADTLTGAGGADILTGGEGADHFVYLKLTDSSVAKSDTITDLESGDVIDLSHIDADTTRNGNQAFHLVDKLTGHAGEAALVYDAAHDVTRLQLDVDGDHKADALILISGDHTDFSLFIL